MIELENGFLVQNASELPQLRGTRLIMDFETTSGDPKLNSKNPWHNCCVSGIGVCNDDSKAYYVPVRVNDPYRRYEVDYEAVKRWVKDMFLNHKRWVNQNVKYDAHVAWNEWGFDFPGELVCTINSRAKLYDSERIYKGGYNLETLVQQLLGYDILKFKNRLQPYLEHSEDYGDIDPLVIGPYGCQDVLSVRDLDDFLPHSNVEQLEIDVTKALVAMERTGMRIAPVNVKQESAKAQIRMFEIQVELYEMYGYHVNPSSNKHMEDILCTVHGLPVLHYTNEDDDEKESNPSFNKYALRDYRSLIDCPHKFIDFAEEYRELKTFNSLFLETYQTQHVNGILHPSYNQLVRTGRMSCGEPNMQQLSKRAKNLILPNHDDWGIFRADYSQIEQRIITWYVHDQFVMNQYYQDPDTDAYLALAKRVGCTRDPAKTIALGSGYGMGMKKLIKQLAAIAEVVEYVKSLGAVDLQKALERHAESIFRQFHRLYSKLKPTTKRAERICRERGFVQTMMGRRRHLPPDHARKAFNAACQGSAADLIKMKVVEFYELLKDTPVRLLAQVHDELVFAGPKEIVEDFRFQRDIMCIMEQNPLPMQIPIRVSGGYSDISWAEASAKKNEFKLPFGLKGDRLSWLK